MSKNTFSLDDLRDALDNEFAPLVITVGKTRYVLRHLLRMGDDERTAVLNSLREFGEITDKFSDDSEDEVSTDDQLRMNTAIADVLRNVVDNNGDEFVKAFRGDVILMTRVMNKWMEATNAGEADNSSS